MLWFLGEFNNVLVWTICGSCESPRLSLLYLLLRKLWYERETTSFARTSFVIFCKINSGDSDIFVCAFLNLWRQKNFFASNSGLLLDFFTKTKEWYLLSCIAKTCLLISVYLLDLCSDKFKFILVYTHITFFTFGSMYLLSSHSHMHLPKCFEIVFVNN